MRHNGKDTCTKTDRLKEAKIAVKKVAGEDAQSRRRRTARPDPVTVGTLLDLLIEDYRQNGQKTLKHSKSQIEHGLRPFFGEMLADEVSSERIENWIAWRKDHRLRGSARSTKLAPASINRELSLLRRGYQLAYERKPQLVEKVVGSVCQRQGAKFNSIGAHAQSNTRVLPRELRTQNRPTGLAFSFSARLETRPVPAFCESGRPHGAHPIAAR